MIEMLEPGDVPMVTRLDRLTRSTRDLLSTRAMIAAKNAGLQSQGDVGTETTTSCRRLMSTVVGGLAEFERDLIRARTAEGRAWAKARGQHMDRPPTLTPQQQKEARRRRTVSAMLKELAMSYDVGRATISRLAI